MNDLPEHFPDIEEKLNARSRDFPILLWVIITYMLLVAVDLFLDLRYLIGSWGNYILIGIMLFIPMVGIWLVKIRKKAGLVTCLLYFGFMSFMLAGYFLQEIWTAHRFNFNRWADGRTMALFGLSALVVIFLLSKDIRKRQSITQQMLAITLIITSLINIVLVVVILNNDASRWSLCGGRQICFGKHICNRIINWLL